MCVIKTAAGGMSSLLQHRPTPVTMVTGHLSTLLWWSGPWGTLEDFPLTFVSFSWVWVHVWGLKSCYVDEGWGGQRKKTAPSFASRGCCSTLSTTLAVDTKVLQNETLFEFEWEVEQVVFQQEQCCSKHWNSVINIHSVYCSQNRSLKRTQDEVTQGPFRDKGC